MVNLLCSFHTPENLYMVMPFHIGGDLSFRVRKNGPLPMLAVRFYVAEILCALKHMHSVNVCHRDIKPDNVLIDSTGHVAVTDFGLAIEIKPEDSSHSSNWWGQCGSYGYRAPEVVLDEPCGFASDIYSLGATTYFLLYGRPPWQQTKQGLEGAPLRFPIDEKISQEFIELVIQMLEFNAKERITIQGIQDHAVFRGVNWDLVALKSKKSGLGKPPFVPPFDSLEFPTSFKNSKPSNLPILTPDQQLRFAGFEWVPGTPVTTDNVYQPHFSCSNTSRGSTTNTSPRPGEPMRRGSSSSRHGTIEEKIKHPGAEIGSIPEKPDSSSRESSQEHVKPEPAPVQHQEPARRESVSGTFPGAHSPRVPVRRMKFKHLRLLSQQQQQTQQMEEDAPATRNALLLDHSAPHLRKANEN